MYTSIYRDFRPDNFDQIIGQDHIVKILKNQLASGRTSHAYLFCGTRGTGKTSTARILAKALNCTGEGEKPCCSCENCLAIRDGSFIDVVEIDAASNNGVDNIRDLRESVSYPPMSGRYKVYIIDEVHMLSSGAFNALLKTLEEPPQHVVFILATTEVQKLPATILSRCMRLDFRRVSENIIISHMRDICSKLGIEAEEGALALIAANADGSVRDSLSILEQCVSGSDRLTRDDTADILGATGEEALSELTYRVMQKDTSGALLQLNDLISSGRDVKQIMKDWLSHFRNLLIAKYVDSPEKMFNMSLENAGRLTEQSRIISTELLDRAISGLTATIADSRWSSQPRVLLEMCAVKLAAQYTAGSSAAFLPDGAEMPRAVEPAADVREAMAGEEPPFDPDPPRVTENVRREQPATELPQAAFGQEKARDTAPAESQSTRKPESSAASADDNSLIWKAVVDSAIAERPSLIRMETKSHLIRIEDSSFYISVDDNITKNYAEKTGREILERLMSERTGRRMQLLVTEESSRSAGHSPEDPAQRAASQIGSLLGVDVEIK